MKMIITYRTIKLVLTMLGFITVLIYVNPVVAEGAPSKKVVIKMATLAPSGSPYHEGNGSRLA